ncbi:MAG TPA: glycosyltransferase family 2 protein, partial [Acidimicrobiales bacterium]|nr:glycosyltransferase family 2 protein [Acidimicrobiales bacterium]
ADIEASSSLCRNWSPGVPGDCVPRLASTLDRTNPYGESRRLVREILCTGKSFAYHLRVYMGPDERVLPPRSVLVVMPAYNAARTLAQTWQAIPADVVHEVLLVDDHSIDATVDVATLLAIRTLALPHNVGYGGNQKACYLEALRLGADVVVMLHPDGQYDPKMIPRMVQPILEGEADLVLGSRMLVPGAARRGKMPLYRFVANKALTWMENRVMGTSFSELHTGYRVYSRRFLQTVPFLRNSNDFVFDTEILAQAVVFHQRVMEVPIETRYNADASSTSMSANIRYGLGTIRVMARLVLHRDHLFSSRLFTP